MLFMITMFEFRLLKKSPVGRLFPASQHVLGRRWFITIQDSPIAPHESVMLTWFAIHNLPGKTSRPREMFRSIDQPQRSMDVKINLDLHLTLK